MNTDLTQRRGDAKAQSECQGRKYMATKRRENDKRNETANYEIREKGQGSGAAPTGRRGQEIAGTRASSPGYNITGFQPEAGLSDVNTMLRSVAKPPGVSPHFCLSNFSSSPFTVTWMLSPGLNSPSRRRNDSGLRSCSWMARLMGRAPNCGS